ncbi:MAG: hypothetical protein ABIQ44_15510, partial [Chloroflexia bacterium]
GNGQFLTYKYGADGSAGSDNAVEIARTWSNIAAQPISIGSLLYFYDKTNGKAMTAGVGLNGKFVPIKEYPGLSKEWTHLVAAPNGVFLIYSAETGNIATDKIADNFDVEPLKRYSPAK